VENGRSTLAILLIVEMECDGLGKEKGGKGACAGYQRCVHISKGDILHSKLDCPCLYIAAGHGIFAGSQEEKESCRNQVGCGMGECSVRFKAISTSMLDHGHRERGAQVADTVPDLEEV
jgi:hypothetical protein